MRDGKSQVEKKEKEKRTQDGTMRVPLQVRPKANAGDRRSKIESRLSLLKREGPPQSTPLPRSFQLYPVLAFVSKIQQLVNATYPPPRQGTGRDHYFDFDFISLVLFGGFFGFGSSCCTMSIMHTRLGGRAPKHPHQTRFTKRTVHLSCRLHFNLT